jgi:hypothetical protein
MARAIGYREALQWIIDNDDCDWLDDEEDGVISVAASFAADIYGKTDEQIIRDLKKLRDTK